MQLQLRRVSDSVVSEIVGFMDQRRDRGCLNTLPQEGAVL
jgi:hypothetical protein